MLFTLLTLVAIANAAVIRKDTGVKIIIGNDDGWAVANVRRAAATLKSGGYQTLISAPADNKSGSSSLEFPPIPLITAGQFNTIPAGAAASGVDASDPNAFYVNSFPATAMEYGIEKIAPTIFGSAPDLAVTGPNVGSNLGLVTQFSGTIGAAAEAVKHGIPAIAFSGAGGSQHIFTEADPVADVYAQVAKKLVDAVVASGAPYLPANVALNVNFPVSDATTCTQLSDYHFVQSRVNVDINPFTKDVNQCGSDHLPTESSVIESGGCRVSVSAFWATSKLDVDKATQAAVRSKIGGLFECKP